MGVLSGESILMFKEVIVKKLTIDEIRSIKAAQAEADRDRFASLPPEERAAEWEARMRLYREAFPSVPAPGTPEWRGGRGVGCLDVFRTRQSSAPGPDTFPVESHL